MVGKDFDESAGFGVLAVNGAYRLNKNFKLSAGVDNLLDNSEHLNLAGSAGFADGLEPTSRVNEPGRTYWARRHELLEGTNDAKERAFLAPDVGWR